MDEEVDEDVGIDGLGVELLFEFPFESIFDP